MRRLASCAARSLLERRSPSSSSISSCEIESAFERLLPAVDVRELWLLGGRRQYERPAALTAAPPTRRDDDGLACTSHGVGTPRCTLTSKP